MAKLTPKQWEKIEKRLENGEKAAVLAREFGISRAAITNRFSKHNRAVETLANTIVETQFSLQKSLQQHSASVQIEAWDMAGELMTVSKHMSAGSGYSAMTFHRMSSIAHLHAQKLDEHDPNPEDVLRIHQIQEVANKASTAPLNLLAANKKWTEKDKEASGLLEMTEEEYLQEIKDTDARLKTGA